jgi:hypothetical protein
MKMVFTGSAGVSPAGFGRSDSSPKQESIRSFGGIVVDSAVLEHDGGRGRPRSQSRSIFGEVIHAPAAHPWRTKRRLVRAARVRERVRLLTLAALTEYQFSEQLS